MPRLATIERLPDAFAMVKAMRVDGLEWGEGYRPLGRAALAEIIEGRMEEAVDAWLDGLEFDDVPDRRNGCYRQKMRRRILPMRSIKRRISSLRSEQGGTDDGKIIFSSIFAAIVDSIFNFINSERLSTNSERSSFTSLSNSVILYVFCS